jgi:hypothetical protein
MTHHASIFRRRGAAPLMASALAPLCRLPPAGTRVRLVPATIAPVAIEAGILATLVLLHHLPALLVAAGLKDTLHD